MSGENLRLLARNREPFMPGIRMSEMTAAKLRPPRIRWSPAMPPGAVSTGTAGEGAGSGLRESWDCRQRRVSAHGRCHSSLSPRCPVDQQAVVASRGGSLRGS